MLKARVERISPEIAAEMLEHNTSNYRKCNMKRVVAYANVMYKGLWELNGEPICFDTNGVLKDGQHRLKAVIMSGTTQDFLVVRDVDPDTIIYNCGQSRTQPQMASQAGLNMDGLTSGVVSIIVNGLNTHICSAAEGIHYFRPHSANFTKAVMFSRRGNANAIMKKSAVIAALYCAICNGLMRDDDLEAFCMICNSGMPKEGYVPDAPLMLRKTLQDGFRNSEGALISGGASLRAPQFETTYSALVAFKEGRKPKTKFKPTGNGNEIINKVKALTDLEAATA